MNRVALITWALATAVLVTACGSPVKANSTTSAFTYLDEVSWHEKWYIPGSINVTRVGGQIGTVQRFVKPYILAHRNIIPSQNISNYAPVGTKLFSIPGINTGKAIAIEYPKGHYVEAAATRLGSTPVP